MENGTGTGTPEGLLREAVESIKAFETKQDAGLDGAQDVKDAVALFELAIRRLPQDDPQAPVYRYNLAIALQYRYDVLGASHGDTSDLLASVSQLEAALEAARRNNLRPGLSAVLSYGLGCALRRVYVAERDHDALSSAVTMLGEALADDDHSDLDVADCYYEYGRALLDKAENDNDPTLLDEAIGTLKDLVSRVDQDHPDLPAYLDAAGSARLVRFEWRDRTADLRAARKLAESAVSCQRARGSVTASAISNLAKALAPQSSRVNVRSEDLHRAIALTREAVELAEQDDRANSRAYSRNLLAGLRSNLAGLLLDEMERTGDLELLDEVVRLADQAVVHSQAGTPELGSRAHQAALAHRTRYLRFNDADDLLTALRFHDIALDAQAIPSDRLAFLDSFGNSLRTRFDAGQDLGDLRKAIAAYEEAISGTHAESPDRAMRLNNIGAAQSALAHAIADDEIAEAASRNLQEAVRLSAPDSLERNRALINLGNVAADRYTRSRTSSFRETAVQAYEQVRDHLQRVDHGTEPLLQAALNAAELADEAKDWPDVVSWSETALDAVDDLRLLQGGRRSKESWLRLVQGATNRAAAAAAAANDLPKAVTLIERGRATLLREALDQSRLDLDRLEKVGGAELRRRIDAVRVLAGSPLEHATSKTIPSRGANLRDLRDEIRGLDGFATFLRPPDFADIAAAAADSPIVYVSAGNTSGTALVVRSGNVDNVPLPGITTEVVRDRAARLFQAHDRYTFPTPDREARRRSTRAWNETLNEVGQWLGDEVGRPLLTLLEAGPVVFIAGGLVSVLPLHAAWWPDGNRPSGRCYLMDALEFSYAPSATAITTARLLEAELSDTRLLTIADPVPTGLPRLTTGLAEADVAAMGGAKGHATALHGPVANIDALQHALPHCELLHAGCHGIADLTDPLQSGLLLAHDERFTLNRLLALTTRIRLAVLSACESGRIGTSLPDEVVSLPSGLIQAGAAGVVASSWAVPAGPTLALMTEFYRLWEHGSGARPASALTQAQAWVRDTSNGAKLDTWGRRVKAGELPESAYDALQDVYLLRERDALDDAVMGAWAPFSHVGC
jgi:CHAT domain-containing protein